MAKAELPQVGIFFALPWEFLVTKKLEIEKNKATFIISVLKVVNYMGLFFQIPTFLLTKVLREGNLFAKKVHSSVNSALTKPENVGR